MAGILPKHQIVCLREKHDIQLMLGFTPYKQYDINIQ